MAFERTHADAIAVFDEAIEEAEEDLVKMGLYLAARPLDRTGENVADRPKLPPNLAECNWAELQQLLGIFTEWFVYASEQKELHTGKRNAADEKKGLTWSLIRKSKEGTIADKDDDTRCDARYQDAQAEYEHYDTMVRILGAMVKGLDQQVSSISRAVTILELRQGVEGKGVGAGRKAAYGDARHKTKTKSRDILHAFRSGQRKGR